MSCLQVKRWLKRKICKCGHNVQKTGSKNYWIEYYLEGKRTRERIGMSKQAAENRLREVQTAKAEGRNIKKNKNTITTLGALRDWYLDLPEVKQKRSFILCFLLDGIGFKYMCYIASIPSYNISLSII